MAASLPNVTTQNGYTAATTLKCPGSVRVNIDVYNASIYYQLGHADAEAKEPAWDDPEVFTARPRSVERSCDGVRVRSAVAGVPAQVSIDAANDQDIHG